MTAKSENIEDCFVTNNNFFQLLLIVFLKQTKQDLTLTTALFLYSAVSLPEKKSFFSLKFLCFFSFISNFHRFLTKKKKKNTTHMIILYNYHSTGTRKITFFVLSVINFQILTLRVEFESTNFSKRNFTNLLIAWIFILYFPKMPLTGSIPYG